MRVKRQEISASLSLNLNAKIVPYSPEQSTEDFFAALKFLRVGKKKRQLISECGMIEGKAYAPPEQCKAFRKFAHSVFAGFVSPSYTRWLTHITALTKLLLCQIMLLAYFRPFGNEISIEGDKHAETVATCGSGIGHTRVLGSIDEVRSTQSS